MKIHVQIETGFKPKDGNNLDALRDALDFFEIPCTIEVLGPPDTFLVFIKGDTEKNFWKVADALEFANIPSRTRNIRGAR